MDGLTLFPTLLFIIGAFGGAIVAGIAGFAFGIIAAGLWLQVLPPQDVAPLIIGYALVIQSQSIWKLRHAIDLGRLMPFVIGGAFGVPLGVHLLTVANAGQLRSAIGVLLLLFVAYSALRPDLRRLAAAGRSGDAAVGLLSGIIGGSTGLAGILPAIWCSMRGWPKDQQRAVFQPVAVALFAIAAAAFGVTGNVSGSALKLFLLGLPFVVLGTWIGLRLYGKLDELGFRRAVLVVLLISGVALLFRH